MRCSSVRVAVGRRTAMPTSCTSQTSIPRFPFIPDVPGEWTARAHAFVLLPVDEPPILIADDVPKRPEELNIDDHVVTGNVIGSVVEAIGKAGLHNAKIGIAGSDTLPWSVHRQLAEAYPDVTWQPADEIMGAIRMVKSPGEIAALRRASKIGSQATEAMLARAEAGVTHGEVVAAGMEVLVTQGGMLYNSFMSSGRGGNNPRSVANQFPDLGIRRCAGRRRLVSCRHLRRGRRLLLRPREVKADRPADRRTDPCLRSAHRRRPGGDRLHPSWRHRRPGRARRS